MKEGNETVPGGSDDPWVGQSLAGYVILRRLGQGGMGVIYLARHESLDRLAAVKFLPSDITGDAAYVELFLREAKAAAKLSHPNIVTVYDAGSLEGGIYYFIMEYVEGHDLNIVLEHRGALPGLEAAKHVRQAAAALAYAHAKRLIHRDVKPENLLLTADGNIKVVDLGLAKWTGEESSMITQTGDVLGSPIYISPERLRDPHTNDLRSDIYSLGGTLYHLVTNKIPYEGTSAVIMSRHLNDPAPDPRDVKPDIDEPLARIIMKMLAKELPSRYQTMEEVEADLAAYIDGKSALPHAKRSYKKAALWAAGLAVIAGVAWVAYASWQRQVQVEAKPETPVQVVEPAPASSLLVADFNSDTRANNIGGTFGSWASAKPAPVGSSSEQLEMSGGPDGSGCWKISFDITERGAHSGVWMQLNAMDVTAYDTLSFKARSEGGEPMAFIVEIKSKLGGVEKVGRQVVRNIGSSWQDIEIPLKSFQLSEKSVLEGYNLVFDLPTTGNRQGTLFIDDIQFTKSP